MAPRHEHGAALILTLVTAALVTALALGLAVISADEVRIAANYRSSVELLYAADAAVEYTVGELASVANWSGVLSGAMRSTFAGASHVLLTPAGETRDLDAVTAQLQADENASGLGANTPLWRLWSWGRLSTMAGVTDDVSLADVAVWVADDASEIDDQPAIDANGIVLVHAEAYGAGSARSVIDATVGRAAAGVRILSWRTVR